MDFGFLVEWLLCVVGLSFFIIPALPAKYKAFCGFVLVTLIASFSSFIAVQSLVNTGYEVILNGGAVFNDIPLRIDSLTAWFMLIINITAFSGAWYGVGYTNQSNVASAQKSLHWISFVVFHASMLGVCMVQHTFAFLVLWEIMSVSSLLLILFEYSSSKTVKAALNYMVQMHIGVVLITVAFIINYFLTGSFDFNSFFTSFSQGDGKWLFLVLFVGFGIKAGFIPLHTWLPHAHPAAPSHVSGVMSGIIVKMGIYGILRMITYLKTDLVIIGEIILILSVITAFYGILNAAFHHDFKKLLAYCTVENIGIIGVGIGIGLIGKGLGNESITFVGFAGAVLHTLNHSLYKSLLFFSAGNVYLQTHTRNMDHLGGIIKTMPITAFFYVCGSLAICGFPPFNGFISEFLIYSGLIKGIQLEHTQFSSLMIVCISFMAIVGGLSLFAFAKSFGTIFLGLPRNPIIPIPKEVSKYMLFPLGFILVIILSIGLFPGLLLKPLSKAVSVFIPSGVLSFPAVNEVFGLMSSVGFASLILLVLCIGIFLVKKRVEKPGMVSVSPTWGCGYTSPNSRMQYSSKSFSRSLFKLFNFLAIEKKNFDEIKNRDIFPRYRSFQSFVLDVFEIKVLQRITKLLLRFIDYFTFIQSGRIQLYILYGVFFILTLIILTFFNIL